MTAATNDEAPAVPAARGFRGQEQDASPDSHATGAADQALLTVEGEDYARQYLERLSVGTARPGELAVIVGFLQGGPMLCGACRAIEKALEGRS